MKKTAKPATKTTRAVVKKTSLKDLSANQKAGAVNGGRRGSGIST